MTTNFNVLTATAQSIQINLQSGIIKSSDLIHAYLVQIEKYNEKLRAIISVAPVHILLEAARQLDEERASGKIRGPLHGIPIILKDAIATDPSLGLGTTVGSFALLDSRPKRNACLVDRLLDAGVIILGKTNLSELLNNKGRGLMAGWSAVGGQCISAYVKGGFRPGDLHADHSSPGGSSTGSAVAVSAGFAPLAIGTETSGSLIEPALRAALFTMKPSVGLISQDGICPISHTFDSAGPMTKSAYDMAVLLDALVEQKPDHPRGSFTAHLNAGWEKIRVGTLPVEDWRKSPFACEPDANAIRQMDQETLAAYHKISLVAGRFVPNVHLFPLSDLELDGVDSSSVINNADFGSDFERYLRDLEYSKVRTLQELVLFNEENSELELPPGYSNQDALISLANFKVPSRADYDRHYQHMRQVARENGVEKTLRDNDIDIILGPGDSELNSVVAASGYPAVTLPLSFLSLNGRPFGLIAIAGHHQEGLLITLLSAWEKMFPQGRTPPNLDWVTAGSNDAERTLA